MPIKVAVVIPVYKAELNELEKISLAQCKKVLGKYPLIFVAPAGAKFSYFAQGNAVAQFQPQFFQSTTTYSQLLMSPFFYEAFKDFDYILIYQLDAFVFYDALEYFCSLGYDYIGAPWSTWYPWFMSIKKNISLVGNGGFSLRNVKAHYNVVINHSDWAKQLLLLNHGEDTFFSLCGKRTDCDFRVAPINIAYKFSAECTPERIIKKNGGNLPFGCHAWTKVDVDFYVKLFSQFDYDLRPVKDKMRNGNFEKILRDGLLSEAFRRFNRRLWRGQSILRYLPTRRFASVRVIRHPFNMMILARLLLEDNSLADKVFIYDPDEQDLLLQDLTLQKQPHLLISFPGDYDNGLISAVEQRGFLYGKRVVSFWREYLTRCERLFRNLGK